MSTDSHKDRKHCPEIEELMSGGGPFITRHGVTVTVLVIVCAGILLVVSDGNARRFVGDMLDYLLAHIMGRFA